MSGGTAAVETLAVETRGLSVRYGDVIALVDVDLSLAAGEITGLVGVNGSGKSSFLGAILGTVPATGEVRVLGTSRRDARRTGIVAAVPQLEQVDWGFPLTVADVVMTGRFGRMGMMRRPRAADREAVAGAIDRLGLTQLADRQIGELSGGQRKRAFVARGIAQGARLLLLDEPFAGVDVASEERIVEVLRELRDAGTSIVISNHDLGGVTTLCDSVVLFMNRVEMHGTPAETLTPERIARAFGAGPRDSVSETADAATGERA